MDIRDAHNQFVRECQDGTLKRRAEATIKGYESSFDLLLKLLPITSTAQLNEGIMRQFFKRGEDLRNWLPATVITHRKNLSPFFKWCMRKGYLETDPIKDIPVPPLLKRTPEYYTKEEIDKIMYAVDVCAQTDFERKRNKAIMGVLLMAGLRKGELLALKMSDVSFESNTLRVRAETSKSRSPRVLPLTARLKELLLEYIEARKINGFESYSLWLSTAKGERFTEHGIKHLFNRLSGRLGFKIKAHKCRHTFATHFYDGSLDIVSLQQALGHQEVTTTMVYTHINQKQMAGSMEKNPINTLF